MAASTRLTPEQRSLRSSVAGNTRWAAHPPQMDAAHAGFLATFLREVDPNNELEDAERARRAHCALRAHMRKLAFASSKARTARKAAKAAEAAKAAGQTDAT